MTREDEHEVAYELTHAAHERLRIGSKALGVRVVKVEFFDTAYYDSSECLRRCGSTLRARFPVDRTGSRSAFGKATLKVQTSTFAKGTSRHALEFSEQIAAPLVPLDSREFPWWAEDTLERREVCSRLQTLGAHRATLVGVTRSCRHTLSLGSGTFELDTVVLPDGRTLFELELEGECHESRLALTAKIFSIIDRSQAELSTLNKYERFCVAMANRLDAVEA